MTRFYVISGAHGVGKTTVAALVRQLMNEHGHTTTTFHHRANKAAIKASSQNKNALRATWKRKLWHQLPAGLRAWIVATVDEIRYARNVASQIAVATANGDSAISDRYVYDRLVDLRLHGRSRPQVSTVGIACRLMRKPDMTFLLTDTPERINARKDELLPDQIAIYQDALRALFVRLCIPFQEIDVDGRTAAAVASDIANAIEITEAARVTARGALQ
jgi:thymidylate kinase